MSTIAYTSKRFHQASLKMVDTINEIIRSYLKQGYLLTIRQLYYQLVARAFIDNNEREYQRIIVLCNDARMAGLMDWDAIEDRGRDFISATRWESGAAILRAAAESYHEDMWSDQRYRVFCIVEKAALTGVLDSVCRKYDIPLLAARGYASASVLHEFAIGDLVLAVNAGQIPVVLYLGDHDPSGLDMTRDIKARLNLFVEHHTGGCVEVARLALNMDQIEEVRPPENPAKTTDRRFEAYRVEFGTSSWELDALRPEYLGGLEDSLPLTFIRGWLSLSP